MTLDEFYEKLKIIKSDDYLVWISCKYKHEKQWDYIVEYLEYDGSSDNYIWLNDWHEGQEDVVILGFIAMEDLTYNMIKWEELDMVHNEDIKNMEWNLSHNKEFVEKNREILQKLGDILPPGENFKVSTAAGHCSLSLEEIFMIKTAVRCSMEECAAWVEQKTKELEGLKNGKEKQN